MFGFGPWGRGSYGSPGVGSLEDGSFENRLIPKCDFFLRISQDQPFSYWCGAKRREWMGCWGLLGWWHETNVMIYGSFPKIPCVLYAPGPIFDLHMAPPRVRLFDHLRSTWPTALGCASPAWPGHEFQYHLGKFHHDLTSRPSPGIMFFLGTSSPNGRKIQVSERFIIYPDNIIQLSENFGLGDFDFAAQVMFWLNRQQIVEHSDGQECLLFLGVRIFGTAVLNKSYETPLSTLYRYL